MSIISQLLTGKDNETHNLLKWVTAIAFLVGLGLEVARFIITHTFDLANFSQAVATLTVSSGVAVRVQAPAEPSSSNT